MKNTSQEVRQVIDHLFDGVSILASAPRGTFPGFLPLNAESSDDLKGSAAEYVERPEWRLYRGNPDLFYALLQFAALSDFRWQGEDVARFKALDPKVARDEMLAKAHFHDPVIETIHNQLEYALAGYAVLSDDELKARVTRLVTVRDMSLIGKEDPVVYTKINHGYWEFLLNSFVPVHGDPRFRDVSHSIHPESWRKHGFHAALFDAFKSIIDHEEFGSYMRIGIGLTAGNQSFGDVLGSDLTKVSRGAIVGLSGFMAGLRRNTMLEFAEGTAPRDMIKDGSYAEFFGRQINQYDALLLLVPPRLKQLHVPHFHGPVVTMALPTHFVHETFRVLVPMILGSINKLLQKHARICILTQSAVLAPLLAIHLCRVFSDASGRIAFYDLGRILDLARPELVAAYPSLSWVLKSNLHQDIASYFNLSRPGPNFAICSEWP